MTPPPTAALFLLGVLFFVMIAVPYVAAFHQWRWMAGFRPDGTVAVDENRDATDQSRDGGVPADD